MNKETKEYFEKSPHLLKDLMKASFEDALKKVSGKTVQIVEKLRKILPPNKGGSNALSVRVRLPRRNKE